MLIIAGNDVCCVRRDQSFIIQCHDSSLILLYICIPLSTNFTQSQTVLTPGISPSIARSSDFIYPSIKMPGSKTFFSAKPCILIYFDVLIPNAPDHQTTLKYTSAFSFSFFPSHILCVPYIQYSFQVTRLLCKIFLEKKTFK